LPVSNVTYSPPGAYLNTQWHFHKHKNKGKDPSNDSKRNVAKEANGAKNNQYYVSQTKQSSVSSLHLPAVFSISRLTDNGHHSTPRRNKKKE
jgi:hypothetical protein